MEFRRGSKRGGSAFTIVELLVVMAIVGILAGIYFGVSGGVRERAKVSRAEGDLQLLAQYLEEYRGHYGDYPWATPGASAEKRNEELYDALNGMRTVHGAALSPRQRAFVDRTKFNFEYVGSATPTNPEEAPALLLDPWGNPYRYYYDKSPATGIWSSESYVLYSAGPDGEDVVPRADGTVDRTDLKNTDNVYVE